MTQKDLKNETTGSEKNGKTWRNSAGDALEKIGHKISDVGLPSVGQKIHDLGDKLEENHANKSHPHKV